MNDESWLKKAQLFGFLRLCIGGLILWQNSISTAASVDEVLLAAKGADGPAPIVYAQGSHPAIGNICNVFRQRIEKRIDCRFHVLSEDNLVASG